MIGWVTFGAVGGIGAMRIKNIQGRKLSYTDQQKKEMLEEAVENGWNMSQAGKEFKFDVGKDTIKRWCTEFGIVLTPVRSSDCSHCGRPLLPSAAMLSSAARCVLHAEWNGLVVQGKGGRPAAKIVSKETIDDLRSRKYQSEAAEELGVAATTLLKWFKRYYPDPDERWSTGFAVPNEAYAERVRKQQAKLDMHCELERRLEEVHGHWRLGHTMQHTVRALNIEGLTVRRLRAWCDSRVTKIYWRHRLTCRDLSPDLDWFIDWNE